MSIAVSNIGMGVCTEFDLAKRVDQQVKPWDSNMALLLIVDGRYKSCGAASLDALVNHNPIL